MGLTKSVVNIIPGMMAISLVGKSSQMIPKDYKKSKSKKIKSYPKKSIKQFTDIMIGVPLIGATSNIVSGIK